MELGTIRSWISVYRDRKRRKAFNGGDTPAGVVIVNEPVKDVWLERVRSEYYSRDPNDFISPSGSSYLALVSGSSLVSIHYPTMTVSFGDVRCEYCGTKQKLEDIFCPQCGAHR